MRFAYSFCFWFLFSISISNPLSFMGCPHFLLQNLLPPNDWFWFQLMVFESTRFVIWEMISSQMLLSWGYFLIRHNNSKRLNINIMSYMVIHNWLMKTFFRACVLSPSKLGFYWETLSFDEAPSLDRRLNIPEASCLESCTYLKSNLRE